MMRPSLLAVVLLASLCPGCSDDTSHVSGAGPASSTGPVVTPTSGASLSASDGAPTTTSTTSGTTEGEASTSGEASTAGEASTGGGDSCGNAVLDPGEACDEGLELNGPNAFCTEQCALNICGDGLLLVGHEICDEGAANSDAYGSLCTKSCHPGPRCGDNVLQPEHEECDHGPGNETPARDEEGIACDKECRKKARVAFVSSVAYTGALGGLAGADARCRALAAGAGLDDPDRFVAFLSDSEETIASRYGDKLVGELPYMTVTGHKLADSYNQLLAQGPGDAGISRTEHGDALFNRLVATNLAVDGTTYVDAEKATDCAGWMSAAHAQAARVGQNAVPLDDPKHAVWKTEKRWLGYQTVKCSMEWLHLYCFEL